MNIRNLHDFGRGFRRQHVRYALLDLGRRFGRKLSVNRRIERSFPLLFLRRAFFLGLCFGFLFFFGNHAPHSTASRIAVRYVVGVFRRAFNGGFHGVCHFKPLCFNRIRKRTLLLRHTTEINMPATVLVIKGGHG